VRILLDPKIIFEAENKSISQTRPMNLPKIGSQVGIISQDRWITVIRDAVIFLDGDIRLHTRVINRVNDGVAVLPIFNGKVVLIRHYRHALRKSILEIPRGGIEGSDSIEETARNELLEEIQGIPSELIELGFVYGSTNLYANGSHIFFATLKSIGIPQLNEGIENIEQYSPEDVESMVLNGQITESFTIAAFYHAKLRNLL
jgi:ADP-ribose pyrophosphatase